MPKSEIDPDKVVESPESASPPAGIEDEVVLPPEEIGSDEIMLAIKDDDGPEQVLKAVMWGLAEEQKSLKTLRRTKEGEGKDTSHISIKRGTLLKYMSETLLQKQAVSGDSGEVDLRGPRFREVFKMFLDAVAETFDDVKIPSEFKQMFFQALGNKLEGWEAKAEKILKGKEIKKK